MADNNNSVFEDQDFYGAIRFFGNATFKSTGTFVFSGDLGVDGDLSKVTDIEMSGDLILSGGDVDVTGGITTSGGVTVGTNLTVTGNLINAMQEITASTPPSQAELVSALGSASDGDGQRIMVSVTDGSIFSVFSNGTSWFYSAYTVGA